MRRVENVYNSTWHSAINGVPKTVMKGLTVRGGRLTKDEWERAKKRAAQWTTKSQEKRWRRQKKVRPGRRAPKVGDSVMVRAQLPGKMEREWWGPCRVAELVGERMCVVEPGAGTDEDEEGRLEGLYHFHQLKLLS